MKPLGAGVFFLASISLPAQTLTPREVFYGEGKPVTAAKPQVRKPKPILPPRISQPPSGSVSQIPPEAAGQAISYQPVSSRPLGLKYSVLKRDAAGGFTEVDPDSTFVANDQIRLMVESNDPGYLYVVMQGSSGKWEVLYPSSKSGGGGNRIEKGTGYSIPPGHVFTFDEKSGSEKLFVVLSRQPETDLESLIYSLQEKQPKKGEISRPMLAQNDGPVQDELVQRLRQTYSRDLLIEKVDDVKTPPSVAEKNTVSNAKIPFGEKAVYVVNPSVGANARVVADIELRHQ